MQIVIDIPEEVLKTRYYTDYFGCGSHKLTEILDNAIPLPKHGRLIDADALDKHMEVYAGVTIDTYDARTMIDDAPTILEATEGEQK